MGYQSNNEIKYPHMLLDLADKMAKKAIYDNSRSPKIKLSAMLYLWIRGHADYKSKSISIPTNYLERNKLYGIVYYLLNGDDYALESNILDARNDFYNLIKAKHFRTFNKLRYSVREGLFIDVILREKNIHSTLFTKDLLEDLISVFSKRNDKNTVALLQMFSAVYLSDTFKVQMDIDWENLELLDISLLSHLFFKKYKIDDNIEILCNHYLAIKAMITRLRDVLDYINYPSEEVLNIIFKISNLLYLSGYYDSLSLPDEERLKYLELGLKAPSFKVMFKTAVANALKVGFVVEKIPKTDIKLSKPAELKIPLWIFALISSILSILMLLIPQLLWKILIVYIIVSGYLIYKLFNLEKDILKELDRGDK